MIGAQDHHLVFVILRMNVPCIQEKISNNLTIFLTSVEGKVYKEAN